MFGSLSIDGMSQMPHCPNQLPRVERRVWRQVAILGQRSAALHEEDFEDGRARPFIIRLINAECEIRFSNSVRALSRFAQENRYDLVQVSLIGR
jgi:hypothetical protein